MKLILSFSNLVRLNMNCWKLQFYKLNTKLIRTLLMFTALLAAPVYALQIDYPDTLDIKYIKAKEQYRNGLYSEALQELNEILVIKKTIKEDVHPKYHKVFNRMGVVYISYGNWYKAIKNYELALQYTNEAYYQAGILTNIGNSYSLKGDYHSALSYYGKALTIALKQDPTQDNVDEFNFICAMNKIRDLLSTSELNINIDSAHKSRFKKSTAT